MAALLGATNGQAEDACTAAPDACWVANDNAPGQVVIAGTPDGVEAGSARAKELGVKRATPLNVGGAFHTPLMDDAAVNRYCHAVIMPVDESLTGGPDVPILGCARGKEIIVPDRAKTMVHELRHLFEWHCREKKVAGR